MWCDTVRVSFLFGGGRGRANPEMAEGRRQADLRFARDIGDEATLNRNGARAPIRRRVRMWPMAIVAAVMVLGALGLLPHVHSFELTRSCTTPAVALERYDVAPGLEMEWKGTGPNSGDYVLVAGGGTVTAQGDTVRVAGGSALSEVFQMTNCLTDQTLAAPRSAGTYDVRLMHRTDVAAPFREVTSVALTVK